MWLRCPVGFSTVRHLGMLSVGMLEEEQSRQAMNQAPPFRQAMSHMLLLLLSRLLLSHSMPVC